MFQLRIVLFSKGEKEVSAKEREYIPLPADFNLPRGTRLVRYVDWPVVPVPGQHLHLGTDNTGHMVHAVTHMIPDPGEDARPVFEVHCHIGRESELIIAHGLLNNEPDTMYEGFKLDGPWFVDPL